MPSLRSTVGSLTRGLVFRSSADNYVVKECALLAEGTRVYEMTYHGPEPRNYQEAVSIFRQAIVRGHQQPAAYFALGVAYKAWCRPDAGAEAAFEAAARCPGLCGMWADAVELCYSCCKMLSMHEIERLKVNLWWWTDDALRLFSKHAVECNENDPRAWVMRAEVLCGLFGRASWPGQAALLSHDYREASEAFKTAAKLVVRTSDAAWKQRLQANSERCFKEAQVRVQ